MTSKIWTHHLAGLLAAGFLAAACGGAPPPPPELSGARAEYSRAKQGLAARLDPTDLHEADLALGRAEKAFSDDPDSMVTRDLAAIALLKAQSAESAAAAMQATDDAARAQKDLQNLQADQLRQTRGALNAAQGTLNQTQQQLEAQKQETAAERKKRMDAEAQLQNARDTLARIANVKDDDRGMVVTFQGEALFKTGKSDLLPAAMVKLDQVADTLKGQERHILVVGHTDSVGGNGSYNQNLSEKRASAVRDYLVAKGIPSDLVRSEGRGASQPVADNTSIEGRAANRRVEIIVQPKGQ